MKKGLIFLIILTFIVILGNRFSTNSKLFGSVNEFLKVNLSDNLYVITRIIFSNRINTLRNLNDYNVSFLPVTEFQNLKFTKIKVNELEKEEAGYLAAYKKKQFSFHFARYNDHIFLAGANGKIIFSKVDELKNSKPNFQILKHNLKDQKFSIRDIIIDDKKIYISIDIRRKKDCSNNEIFVANIDLKKKIEFKNLFSSLECVSNLEAGKMQMWERDGERSILLSTSADGLKNDDESDPKPQNDKSLYGKILLINIKNGDYKIFSKGHRNTLGLYANIDENIILNTENGPKGGDEINSILFGKNYGWDIASYGTKYQNSLRAQNYKLSHEDNGFEEPIYSFVPSIGISEIVKIENNFSKNWFNNFLIGSMNSLHLYRVKFDNNYLKTLFVEKIYIGERIRDLIYLSNEKKILLALEGTGSIGILEVKDE